MTGTQPTTVDILRYYFGTGISIQGVFRQFCDQHGWPEKWIMHSSVIMWLERELRMVSFVDGANVFFGIPIRWDDTQGWDLTVEQIVKNSLAIPVESPAFCETMCHLDYVL